MNPEIPLSEKIYLLSIHPTKGGIRADSLTALKFVLTGSLLLELYMSKKIRFEGKLIVVADSESDNELHQFLLDKLGAVKKPLKVARWMNKLQFSSQYIKKRIRQNLEEKRIIKAQRKRFLFFTWKQSVIVNKPVVSKMITETDRAIYRSQVSEEEMVLLSMLRPAGSLKRIYPDRAPPLLED